MAITVPSGSIRFNTDSSKLEIYNGEAWFEINATSPELHTGGTRGVFGTGVSPGGNVMDYINVSSTGNAIDFGNQSKTGGYQSAAANSVRGLWAGGYSSSPRQTAGFSRSIEAITIASQGTSQFFGDLINTPMYGDGSSTSTRAIFAGSGGTNNTTNNIEFVTIATFGNAQDFGDLTHPVGYAGVTSDSHGGLGGY